MSLRNLLTDLELQIIDTADWRTFKKYINSFRAQNFYGAYM